MLNIKCLFQVIHLKSEKQVAKYDQNTSLTNRVLKLKFMLMWICSAEVLQFKLQFPSMSHNLFLKANHNHKWRKLRHPCQRRSSSNGIRLVSILKSRLTTLQIKVIISAIMTSTRRHSLIRIVWSMWEILCKDQPNCVEVRAAACSELSQRCFSRRKDWCQGLRKKLTKNPSISRKALCISLLEENTNGLEAVHLGQVWESITLKEAWTGLIQAKVFQYQAQFLWKNCFILETRILLFPH